MPVIDFVGTPPVAPGVIPANIAHCKTLGLPSFRQVRGKTNKLALIGGGPSINDRVAEIVLMPDILAINGAWTWCFQRGLTPATFFAIDPCPIVAEWAKPVAALGGSAIVANQCDPAVFDVLKDCQVAVFEVDELLPDGKPSVGGSCAATAAATIAPYMGFEECHLFGCEGSYGDEENSHAYMSESIAEWMIVECGGNNYRTRPDFYSACREFAAMAKEFPNFFKDRSGGLLEAMIANDSKHNVWKVSRELYEQISDQQPKEAA